ncbi:hypothetical protein RhiirC2_520074 [Rhizophagus irregularis]|uniref:DASH complex subunit DAD2 n=1 Tax=Rhizophagus irregularis TaxID=588596 RepID=A0A2N1NXE1_9GLOM|nr:hypothetical protein RhiirC2_520074 [Rhizophagus irregularis]
MTNNQNPFYVSQQQPPPFIHQRQQRQIPVNVPSAKQVLLTQKVQEKQQEYDNLLILKKSSQDLSDYFDQLSDNIEELNKGCEAVATVLRNWQTVFRTVLLQEEKKETKETPKPGVSEHQIPVVVRIPMKSADADSK